MLKKEIKICILSMPYRPRPGGLSEATYYLAKELVQNKYEVHIITGTKKAEFSEEEQDDIHVHRISLPYYRQGIKNPNHLKLLNHLIYNIKAIWILCKLRPDIIQCQSPYTSIVALIMNLLFHVPYCITFHEEIKNHKWIMNLKFRRYWSKLPYLKRSSRLIVLTKTMSEDVNDIFPQKTIIIPNGVDTSLFTPSKLKSYNTNASTILCVSRLIDGKGLEDAITAMKFVFDSYPESKLIIVGEGYLKSELVKLTLDLDIRDTVIFAGYVPNDEIIQYYHQADIFLLPSYSEGASLVILESMACGLPIIATPVGIVTEMIQNGYNGYIIPKKDYLAISDNIKSILSMPQEQYNKMSMLNLGIVSHYDWKSISKQYMDEYQNIVSRNRSKFNE